MRSFEKFMPDKECNDTEDIQMMFATVKKYDKTHGSGLMPLETGSSRISGTV